MQSDTAAATEALRHPIGVYHAPDHITTSDRERWIRDMAELPANLRDATRNLTPQQLDTPYRPGGWTVSQVVHHLADSHMNAYCRFRLALTEDHPTIKTYSESAWAELADAKTGPVDVSMDLLEALHTRWIMLLESLGDSEYARAFQHPERGVRRLDWTLGLYAWHSKHHVAHIANLRARQGW